MNLIEQLEQEEIARLGKTIPEFAPGDTVIVNVNVVEGERKRVQAYEGVVIGKRNRGLNSAFTVRKISSGEGVERTFQTYSPLIASIEVKRKDEGAGSRKNGARSAPFLVCWLQPLSCQCGWLRFSTFALVSLDEGVGGVTTRRKAACCGAG